MIFERSLKFISKKPGAATGLADESDQN